MGQTLHMAAAWQTDLLNEQVVFDEFACLHDSDDGRL